MKRRFLATAARSGLTTILLVYSAIAHCGEDAFAKWAAAHALPITTLDFAGNDSDLLPLESAIGAARVVAFGEPTHGVHEPLAFRNRLFRFLVERMGFTAIALESGFTESIGARSFIEGGEGDAETAARTGLSSWVNRYLENRELIQWMRDYNAAASSAGHRKIRLYGIDLTEGARVGGPRRALDSRAHLSCLVPTQRPRKKYGPHWETAPPEHRTMVSSAHCRQRLKRNSTPALRQLRKPRKGAAKALAIARSSDEEYRWSSAQPGCGASAREVPSSDAVGSAGESGHQRLGTYNDVPRLRDGGECAMGTGERRSAGPPPHIRSQRSCHEHERRRPPVGQCAREAAHDGFTFAPCVRQGPVHHSDEQCDRLRGASSKPIEEDSIDSALVGLDLPLMFLDVRTGRQNKDVLTWLSTRRSLNANVSAQSLITPSTAVDAFFFVNTLTPAILSSDKAP